jgi:hypothetical protein
MTANKHNIPLKSMPELMQTLYRDSQHHEDKKQWLREAFLNDIYESKSHLIAEKIMEPMTSLIEACEFAV